MDRHHSIQLTPNSAAADASTQSSDRRLDMSSELYLAVCGGRKEEAVALLLQQHAGTTSGGDQVAGIHQVSAERNTVLHLAAEHGHDELIQELYASFGGTSLLSSLNSALDTPLHCAARAGHDKAVTLLVQLAWDCGEQSVLGCKNEAGDTALHLAARLGHGAAVETMVSRAPGVASAVNDAGVSPLYLAVMSRSVPAIKAITTWCSDASAAGPSSQNALHAAVFQGSEMVSPLLDWKASLASEIDGGGSSPLHFASSDGNHSIIRAILHAVRPSTVRMRDSGGLSALHVAARMGHAGVVEELMKACPDAAELRDDRGGTFLHAAARGGHYKVVSVVIKKTTLYSLLDAQDGDGNTPLHLAVDASACYVVKALISRDGARTDVMNKDGHTPLDLAAKSTSFFSMLGLVVTLTTFGARSRPRRLDHVERWSGRNIAEGIEKTSDSLAVVAVLVATVAFSAAFNLPRSYNDNGMAVLQGKTIFKFFLVLDSFAMITSVTAAILLVYGKASRSAGSWKSYAAALNCLLLSLVSLILAFWAALAAATRTRAVSKIAFNIIYTIFCLVFILIQLFTFPPVSMWSIWMSRIGRHHVGRKRIRQQFPHVGAFLTNMVLFTGSYCLAIAGFTIVSFFAERDLLEAP